MQTIKLFLVSRLKGLSLIMKVALAALLIVVVLALISIFVFKTSTPGTSWIDQPVMLRILKGQVDIYDTRGGTVTGNQDETWLGNGNYLDVKADSSAVLQYFDGSEAIIDGPAEVIIEQSRSIKGKDLDGGRNIGLNVLLGKVTISAVKQLETNSQFEVRTPNSTGAVVGTIFSVSVDENQGVIWETNQGLVRVGAITWDNDMQASVALILLHANDALSLAPLAAEWKASETLINQLITITAELVRKSVKEDKSDVSVKGSVLVEQDPSTDTAVYRFDKPGLPAATAATAPELPPGFEEKNISLLAELTPALVVEKSTSTLSWYIPVLPTPSIWVKPAAALKRTKPPAYLFSISDLGRPFGVTVTPDGLRVYVTESGGDRVTKVFDRNGKELVSLYPPGTVPEGRSPNYVAVDRRGVVYISDRLRQTIDVYDVDGSYLGSYASLYNLDISWSPLGLDFDPNGNLYVTDVGGQNHRILEFDQMGQLKLNFGQKGDGDGQFSFPNDIAVDNSGWIYISDSSNYRIQVFDAQGIFQGSFSNIGGTIGFPRGLKIDLGYLYIVDTTGHTVHVYDNTDGVRSAFSFGELGFGDGQFNFPNDIDIDSTGRIYVTDRENSRVQVWTY